jgi:hypothetical protein
MRAAWKLRISASIDALSVTPAACAAGKAGHEGLIALEAFHVQPPKLVERLRMVVDAQSRNGYACRR